MLTHYQIWAAIDALAKRFDLTASGLAKKAGLDPTTFNKSKRKTPSGKERWPSTESLAKILQATETSLDDFVALVSSAGPDGPRYTQPIPLIGMSQAGAGGFFDDGGCPIGSSWDQVRFLDVQDDNVYALEVTGDGMEPLYRQGDVLIISPNSEVRRGDRIVIKTVKDEVMAKILNRKTAKKVELESFNPKQPKQTFDLSEIIWMARILWVSQ